MTRRVGIYGVTDANAEARNAGVEDLDALTRRCRRSRSQVAVGNHFAVGHLVSCSPADVGYGWATNPRRSPVNVCECLHTAITECDGGRFYAYFGELVGRAENASRVSSGEPRKYALWAGIALAAFYAVMGTLLLPRLWIEPLGPLLKIGPIVLLMAVALAVLRDR
jgi:DoxX-like family